ncbi:MAG: DeoR/GlpR family DNA-binding transcription regulator [Pseudomonadota bacterium]
MSKNRNSAARRLTIQRQLLVDGAVTVEALARDLGVSEATIRRDLSVIEQDGAIRRTHGGAIAEAPRGADQAFAIREQQDEAAKRAIARYAMTLVAPDQTLLMNDGSTILALARELVASRMKLTVITPGVNIATYLSECPDIAVYLLGGQLRHQTLSTSGGFAESMLGSFNADIAFMSAEGLSAKSGLTYSYETDAVLAAAMRSKAKTTIVLATSRKIGQRDRITALPTGEIDLLVTDCQDSRQLQALSAAGVDVEACETREGKLESLVNNRSKSGA